MNHTLKVPISAGFRGQIHSLHFSGKHPKQQTLDYSGDARGNISLSHVETVLLCKRNKASLRWEEAARSEPRDQGTDSGEILNFSPLLCLRTLLAIHDTAHKQSLEPSSHLPK